MSKVAKVPGWASCVCLCALGIAASPAHGAGGLKKPRVAVVAGWSGDARALADLLTAELSKTGRVDLVERSELKKVVKEKELQTLFGARNARSRRRLGSFLRAEFLLLLHVSGHKKALVSESVIAETRFGYRLCKQVRRWNRKDIGAASEDVSALLLGAVERFRRGVKLAVAIPPFYSRSLTHRFDYLQAAYARTAELEVVRRPGCVVVELEEARAVADEFATSAGSDLVRRALPHYIIGEFRHDSVKPGSPLTVSMRLELDGKTKLRTSKKHDDAQKGAEFVRKTTGHMLDQIAERTNAPKRPRNVAAEVNRLAESAQSFLLAGSFEQAAALLEAAVLLDPKDVDVRHGAHTAYSQILSRSPAAAKAPELRRGLGLALRAVEHLRPVARGKRFGSSREFGAVFQDFWDALTELATAARKAKLAGEVAALEQAKRDFFLHDYVHTWRKGLWPGFEPEKENFALGRVWARVIPVHDLGRWPGILTKRELDYRLKLIRAVLAGKPDTWDKAVCFAVYNHREPVHIRYDAREKAPRFVVYNHPSSRRKMSDQEKKAVEQSLKLYDRFIDELARDRDRMLRALARYLRFRKDHFPLLFPPRSGGRRRPDFIELCELNRAAQEFKKDGFWQPANSLWYAAGELRWSYQSSMPSYKRREPPAPFRRPRTWDTPGDHFKSGRLAFERVKIKLAGRPLGVNETRGVVRCCKGVDAFWTSSAMGLMYRKGTVESVFSDPKTAITGVCWDGKWLWAATRQDRILLVDPLKKSMRTIGKKEGVPGSGMGMRICALGPGRAFVVGSIPPHRRAWCALVTADGKVDVFHEARLLGKTRDDAAPDVAFAPEWICPIRSADGKTVEQILVGRAASGLNKYSVMQRPLVVDPRKRTAASSVDLGMHWTGWSHRASIVRAGDYLFKGGVAYRLPKCTFERQVLRARTSFSGTLLKVEDKVYGLGPRWLEIDPGTLGFTRVNEEALLRGCCVERAAWSWHYGILGWQGYRCKGFFQISIAKAPARDKEGAPPAEVKEAPPAASLPGDRRR